MKSPNQSESQLSSEEISMILDSIADGVFTVNKDFVITSFNKAAEEITGVPVDQALGKPCCEVFRAEICEGECALKQTIIDGKPIINKPVFILKTNGTRVPISISTSVFKDREGNLLGGVETFRDLTLVESLRKEIRKASSFEDMISRSPKMKEIFMILPDVAMSDSIVLIQGESGTGKELLAKAIHNLSSRGDKPLITVNCGAIPDTLLESELFGYNAGAFTGAKKNKPGRFALADGGTIFLDEIGDVSPSLQVRLLRVLQEKTFEPLGAVSSRKVDVRVIAATNKNLQAMVESGEFREDLYYRIKVFIFNLPPLRERREDIPLLVENFITRFNRLKGKDIAGLSGLSMSAFMQHDWPGNIRELENAIEHAFILCHGSLIEPVHLPEPFRSLHQSESVVPAGLKLDEIEVHVIREALKRNNYRKLQTARELGISKTTLWRKMKEHGLDGENQAG